MNEVAGVGNHYTALFWEYDSRLGKRWNLDPKPNVSISLYSSFSNNPIVNQDLLGDTIRISGSPGFQQKVFAHLQMLTSDKLKINEKGVVEIERASDGRRLNKGTNLVRSLIVKNNFGNVIVESNTANETTFGEKGLLKRNGENIEKK